MKDECEAGVAVMFAGAVVVEEEGEAVRDATRMKGGVCASAVACEAAAV